MPDYNAQFSSKMVKGLGDVIKQHKLAMMLFGSDNKPDNDLQFIKMLHMQRVMGIVYTPATDYADEMGRRVKALLDESGIPVVLMDRRMYCSSYDGVFTDNVEAAYTATKALIQAGHTRIGFVVSSL